MSFTFKNSVNQPVTADLKTDRYINDNLAILVFETEPEEYDDGYYCDLTTNFAETLESPDMFYLNTNNAPANLIYVHQLPPTEVGGLFLSSVVKRLKADSLPKDSVLRPYTFYTLR